MNAQVSKRITFLGFLMTCVMVMFHCGSADGAVSAADAQWVTDLAFGFDRIANFAMGYFFTVTGFLLFHGLSFSTYPRKIKSRVTSLLVPYLSWQLLFTLPTVLRAFLRGRMPELPDWFGTVFLLQRWPPDGALWYVYAVFLLAVLSPPLLLFRRKRAAQIGVVIMVLAVYLLGAANLPPLETLRSYGCLNNIWMYLPAYLIGAYYGAFGLASPRALGLLAVLLGGAVVLTPFCPGILPEMALRVLPTALLCLLPVDRIRGTARVYRLSFLMYALHEPLIPFVLRPMRQVLAQLLPYAAAVDLSGRVLYLAFDIALAAAMYVALQKVCPKLLRALTGGRG